METTAHRAGPPKVILYTTFAELFGDLCHSWRATLERHGHAAEVVALPNDWPGPLPAAAGADVNLLVAGLSLLRTIGRHGLPRQGRNVLWVFEPLTEDAGSTKHYHKAAALNAVGHRIDAFVGMDHRVVTYLRSRYPDTPRFCVPFTVAEEAITPPLADGERTTDVLWLARLERSARRQAAAAWFRQVGFPVRLLTEGVYGPERDRVVAGSRLSLEVHGDHLRYCNQCRLFLAQARGSVVVAEPCDDYAAFGLTDGVHLIAAELPRFPEACADLLRAPRRREQIARAAQELLRQRYTPGPWAATMLDVLHAVAPARA